MLSSSSIPLSALVELCRVLRHNLGAGISLRDVFRQQAKRGPTAIRGVAEDLATDLGKGRDLEHALEKQRHRFPSLFVDLAIAGERSGSLPEVFTELESYYRLCQRLNRQLWTQLSWPLTQLVLGVFVIAGMLFILGIFDSPFDPLGFGLTGSSGALTILGIAAGMGVLAFVAVKWLRRRGLDAWLLNKPVVGPCVTAFALQRFSIALRLTSGTGMPIAEAVTLSLRATGNAAFTAATEPVVKSLKAGEELVRSLRRGKVFPRDYLDVLSGAEEAGRLDDVLEHQSRWYAEESERRLTTLTKAIGATVWVLIGGIMVFFIFRIAGTYIGMINQAV